MNNLGPFLRRRYSKTIKFIYKHVSPPSRIIDLGVKNKLSELLLSEGFCVENTHGEDLDIDFHSVQDETIEVVTSFEVFEHLLAPYNILREIKSKKLIASVPLQMLFAKAYWNEMDERDRHFHEFERRQFDFLLEKTGWKIIDYELWTAPIRKIGIRPFLRLFIPRYYIVYCERIPL